jgi:hypothetical protein
MTAPSARYDGDRNLRLIKARCADVLSDDDLIALMQQTCRQRSASSWMFST